MIPWKKSPGDKDRLTVFIDPDMLKDVPRYSRQDLEVACKDFSNIIGSSSDSVVYKGTIKDGPEIAVISFCIKEENGVAIMSCILEVVGLARLDHERTGKLLGYCRERSPFTRILVFEYASNGTLSEHLHSMAITRGGKVSTPCRSKEMKGIDGDEAKQRKRKR